MSMLDKCDLLKNFKNVFFSELFYFEGTVIAYLVLSYLSPPPPRKIRVRVRVKVRAIRARVNPNSPNSPV